MNQKLFFIVPLSLIPTLTLNYCSYRPYRPKEASGTRIESDLCLNIDHTSNPVKLTRYDDNHDRSNGDGRTYAILKYAKPITEKLWRSKYWLPLPMPENLEKMLFGWTEGNVIYGGTMILENGFIVPEDGYWFYSNDFDPESQGNRTFLPDVDVETYDYPGSNYTVGWYDTVTDTLYYYELDI